MITVRPTSWSGKYAARSDTPGRRSRYSPFGRGWLKRCSTAPGGQLFRGRDDWQAIYRFGGSDIAVMREFGDHFGAFERIDLATTFRCADRIASLATDFVLRNPAQIRKTVRATRKADRPAVYVGLSGEQELSLLKEALDRIAEDARRHEGTSEVLLLGRYRHLCPRNLGALPKQYPGLRFSWKTVHRSKGLEADYAVVLGLCSGKFGFPAEIADDPLLDLVLAAPEAHPNAEERRLLYVAITRARRQVYLLADGPEPIEEDRRYDSVNLPPGKHYPVRSAGGGWARGNFFSVLDFPLRNRTAPVLAAGQAFPSGLARLTVAATATGQSRPAPNAAGGSTPEWGSTAASSAARIFQIAIIRETCGNREMDPLP